LLPPALLALSNNMPDSARFGEILAAEAFSDHVEGVFGEAADVDSVVLAFSLTSKFVDEETCGVKRCFDPLARAGLMTASASKQEFEEVAFMSSGHPSRDSALALRVGRLAKMGSGVSFPEFTGISVNMMPFVLGDKTSLPESLHSYWSLVQACKLDQSNKAEIGKIGYLTVDEKEIREDQTTHRRAGLHTDSAGLHVPGLRPSTLASHRRGSGVTRLELETLWGGGYVIDGQRSGGIYMASNVDDSCQIFNAIVEEPQMIGHLGSCEHLRSFLGEGVKLKANELCWFTDRTPHESLPLPAGTRRQFFRLVTSQVDVWFQDHSTTNPTGVKPPASTQIIAGSKFQRRQGKIEIDADCT